MAAILVRDPDPTSTVTAYGRHIDMNGNVIHHFTILKTFGGCPSSGTGNGYDRRPESVYQHDEGEF